MNKKIFLKAMVKVLKEAGRWAVLASIPVVLVYLDTIPTDLAISLAAFLRLLDKFIHAVGKEMKNEKLIKGLKKF